MLSKSTFICFGEWHVELFSGVLNATTECLSSKIETTGKETSMSDLPPWQPWHIHYRLNHKRPSVATRFFSGASAAIKPSKVLLLIGSLSNLSWIFYVPNPSQFPCDPIRNRWPCQTLMLPFMSFWTTEKAVEPSKSIKKVVDEQLVHSSPRWA